eukprot:5258460-Pleurochrysis_carterae.AAC.3
MVFNFDYGRKSHSGKLETVGCVSSRVSLSLLAWPSFAGRGAMPSMAAFVSSCGRGGVGRGARLADERVEGHDFRGDVVQHRRRSCASTEEQTQVSRRKRWPESVAWARRERQEKR